MRSTGFVVLSVLVHCLAVAAVTMTPVQTVSNAGDKIEVQMGEPADQPGVAHGAPAEAAPAVTEPAPKPAKVARAAKTAAKVESRTSSTPVAGPTEPDEEAAPVAATEEEEKEILMPVKETAPDGVEAAGPEDDAAATEAKSADVQKAADPSPVAVAAVENEGGALAKGGASKEGAISYLDLKQMPGNKSPNYPLKARLEKRQGSLELLYRVTKEGKVADISVAKSSGFKDLDDEAVRAITHFRFAPGQEGWAKHPVSFNLKGVATALPSQLRGKGAQID